VESSSGRRPGAVSAGPAGTAQIPEDV